MPKKVISYEFLVRSKNTNSSEAGFAHIIILLLLILILGLGAGYYLVFQTSIFKPKANELKPVLVIPSPLVRPSKSSSDDTYTNPFESSISSQYTNPFDSQTVNNPFNNI